MMIHHQVAHILYSTGPVSVGYRMSEFHDGGAGANGKKC